MEVVLKFRLDLYNQRFWDGGQPVHIGNKAFQLLKFMVNNPDELLTKDRILDAVWGEISVSEGLVKEYVHDLRVALGDNPKHPCYIETVRGRGYRFLGGIEIIDNDRQRHDSSTTSDSHTSSLAVLPFSAFAGHAVENMLAASLSEDIVVGCSKNPYLTVVSGDPATNFDGKPISLRETGVERAVQYVLKGSVRKSAQRIRITVNLVDTASDRHVWAESYDRDAGDVVAVQDEVPAAIIHALGAKDGAVEKSARQRSMMAPEGKHDAYDYYLQARHHFYRPGDTGFTEAEKLFEHAIAHNSDFARAYSGLASLLFLRFKLFLTASFESIEQRALDLALHAVRLDPDDYLGHWVLGQLYSFQGKHTQSQAQFERALRINPNDANLLVVSSEHLVYCDRAEQAYERCQRAIRLNPNCPDIYWWHLGFAQFHLGQYDEALEALEQMTALDQARRLLTAVYVHLDQPAKAHAEAHRFMQANPGFSVRNWARTEPYINPLERKRYVNALLKGGLPE
jgi:TolB-like protein/Flp pilus assembly protein TadD